MDRIHRKELHPLRPFPLTEAAVLLIGHGSHLSPDSSRPIHQLALRLRRLHQFAEVRTAFWKEEPQLHYAFDLVESLEVFAVPVFMGEGYFADDLVPRELGLTGPLTVRDGQRIHYCPPVGSDPKMAELVMDRATEVVSPPDGGQSGMTLVVVGHGTPRHSGSGDTTFSVVRRLQGESRFAHVVAAFLDQEPTLTRVLESEIDGEAVVVPFFVSEGWHVGTTIPRDLALDGGPTETGGRRIWFTEPVGTHPAMTEVIRDLVEREAEGAPVGAERFGKRDRSAATATEAKGAFLAWIRSAPEGHRVFLQTVVWEAQSGGFEIRHELDRQAPLEALRRLRDPDEAQSIAAATEAGDYRPLKTAPDLRGGWRFAGLTKDEAWEVYAHLYPAVPVHWFLERIGRLPVVSFDDVAKRQTGIHAKVGSLGPPEVGALVEECCESHRCLREPTWWSKGSRDELQPRIPCPAACSVFLSRAASGLDHSQGSR